MSQGVFTGIAIVIDDEFEDSKSEIFKIADAIRAEGGYVIGMKGLPAEGTKFVNFAGASFFILDWNLHTADLVVDANTMETVPLSGIAAEEDVRAKVEFLLELRKHRLAPVFIFTAGDTEEVKAALEENKDLFPEHGASHIFVHEKGEVIEQGVFKVLNDWVGANPSALALKMWEQNYDQAKNDLFLDFYIKSPMWPAILWRTFDNDQVPPSDELGRLISRNLISRMVPIKIDMERFMDDVDAYIAKDPDGYRSMLLGVLEGERFVRDNRLHAESIAPGDVFRKDSTYYLNIRPECDCIARDGGPVTLYLLKGEPIKDKDLVEELKVSAGLFTERDDQALVFDLIEGKSVRFRLQNVLQRTWPELVAEAPRIGRLLPPFITRIQQRYASYLQRPGLPKIPKEAMSQKVLEREAQRLAQAEQNKAKKVEAVSEAGAGVDPRA